MLPVSRRMLLIAASTLPGVSVLAACTSDGGEGGPDAGDVASGAALREADIIARYDAFLADNPGSPLAFIRDQHAEHLAAFGGGDVTPLADDVTVTVTDLAAAEKALSREHAAAAAAGGEPDSVRLLTVVAAAEASHHAYLRRS